jgi:putative transposase
MLKNHAFAKAISDVGWSEFVRQLEYKAAWYGRPVVKIDRWYPWSKTCSACLHVLEELALDVRSWACPNCGTCYGRDINAAKNVLPVGLTALNACGGTVRPVNSKGSPARLDETGTLAGDSKKPLPFRHGE